MGAGCPARGAFAAAPGALVLLVLLVLLPAHGLRAAPKLRLDPSISVWLEHDSNARRVPDDAIIGDRDAFAIGVRDKVADGLARFAGVVVGQLAEPGLLVRGDVAVGAKLFFNEHTERMGVAQGRVQALSRLPDHLGGGVLVVQGFAKLRGQQSGERTYGLFRTDTLVDQDVGGGFAVRAGVGASAFHAFDFPFFSSAGPSLLAGLRYGIGPERIEVVGDVGLRAFPFAPKDPGGFINDAAERRADLLSLASVTATSQRRIWLQGSMTVLRNASNARGESFSRARLGAIVGTRLPASITATAQGALQLTRYDDGLSVGQQYFLADDDETQNILDLQLSRPLLGDVFLEARCSFMSNELAVDGARFSRNTAGVGLRAAL
jgi:hypothetical protein